MLWWAGRTGCDDAREEAGVADTEHQPSQQVDAGREPGRGSADEAPDTEQRRAEEAPPGTPDYSHDGPDHYPTEDDPA
jgi:hypothetical protein